MKESNDIRGSLQRESRENSDGFKKFLQYRHEGVGPDESDEARGRGLFADNMFPRACNERSAALGSSLLGWLTGLVTRLNWHGYFISHPPRRESTPRTTPEARGTEQRHGQRAASLL